MFRSVCVDAAMPTIFHIDLKALSNGFGAVALSPRSDFFVWPWEWSTWLSLIDEPQWSTVIIMTKTRCQNVLMHIQKGVNIGSSELLCGNNTRS